MPALPPLSNAEASYAQLMHTRMCGGADIEYSHSAPCPEGRKGAGGRGLTPSANFKIFMYDFA
jgi:hypothetical protein